MNPCKPTRALGETVAKTKQGRWHRTCIASDLQTHLQHTCHICMNRGLDFLFSNPMHCCTLSSKPFRLDAGRSPIQCTAARYRRSLFGLTPEDRIECTRLTEWTVLFPRLFMGIVCFHFCTFLASACRARCKGTGALADEQQFCQVASVQTSVATARASRTASEVCCTVGKHEAT